LQGSSARPGLIRAITSPAIRIGGAQGKHPACLSCKGVFLSMPTQAAHLWRPSSARAIVLDGFAPVPRGVLQTVPAPPPSWPVKDPGDLLDYQLDVSAALAGDSSDGIATLDVQISPNAAGDLALASAAMEGSIAVFWLSGGQTGTTYTINVSIRTSGGRILVRAVQLPVLALSAPQTASGLTTEAGTPVIDQNGNPLTLG
jgi:hypothetical protein